MKLFENGVGRPSNKTLRKRRLFKISIAVLALFIFVIGFLYFDGQIKTTRLKGNSVNDLKMNVSLDGVEVSDTSSEVYSNGTYNAIYYIGSPNSNNYYYKFISYDDVDINKNKVADVGSCVAFNKEVNVTYKLELNDKNKNKTGTLRVYKNKWNCDNDKGSESANFEKQLTIHYFLKARKEVTIDYTFTGKLNKAGAVLFDTDGDKSIKYSINVPSDGKNYYYKWYTYLNMNDYASEISFNGNCSPVNNGVSGTVGLTLTKNSHPNRLGIMKVYDSLNECKMDTRGNKGNHVKQRYVYYSYNSVATLLPVSITKDPSPVSTAKNYSTTFKFYNLTGDTYYMRWFTFNDMNGTKLGYNTNNCAAYNKYSTLKKPGLSLNKTLQDRKGLYKIYKDKASCNKDNDAKSTSGVISTKSVTYRFNKVFTQDGWKYLRYNINDISKKIGTQAETYCFDAALAYGVYILSDGTKISTNIKTRQKSSYGGVNVYKSGASYFNFIKSKIDNGIPVSIHVKNNHGEHWILVTGYKTGVKNMTIKDLYGIDPFYNKNSYASKKVILKAGKLTDLSVTKLYGDNRMVTWDNVASAKASR